MKSAWLRRDFNPGRRGAMKVPSLRTNRALHIVGQRHGENFADDALAQSCALDGKKTTSRRGTDCAASQSALPAKTSEWRRSKK